MNKEKKIAIWVHRHWMSGEVRKIVANQVTYDLDGRPETAWDGSVWYFSHDFSLSRGEAFEAVMNKKRAYLDGLRQSIKNIESMEFKIDE